MKTEKDVFLIERLQKGDVAAFEHLFHTYYSELCRYALLFIDDEAAAENIVQDLFIYIWEHRETIEFQSSYKNYLFQAARYKVLNYKRNKALQERKREEIGKKTSDIDDFRTEEAIELKELNRIIDEAIALLPDKCQQIFRLSRKDELSYHEIAELMLISESTVKNHISTAIKKIKSYIRLFYPDVYILLFLLGNHKI
jgi:RNA polymerase sigma-70 factor (ECF subfamily)